MDEAWCKCADGNARTTSDIKNGVELATSGLMAVHETFIEFIMVLSATLGIILALLLVEGAKCGFCYERGWSGCCLGHG